MQNDKLDYVQKFRTSSLDTDPVGIHPGSEYSYCAATPPDARVVAWTELNGVHFCRIEGSPVIYAVEPEAAPAPRVYAVAEDFVHLMGLIAACSHVGVLLRARSMTRPHFEELCAAQRPGAKQRSVLRAIGNIYHSPVIDDPYGYMEKLRKST